MNSFVFANLVINIFMAASLQYLWSLMNVIQLIVHEPLLSISFPAEARIFLEFLQRIIKFKIIPTDKILSLFMNVKEKTARSDKFGYESGNMLQNIGAMVVLLPVFAMLIALLLMLRCLLLKYAITAKLYKFISTKLMFNSICRVII